MTTIDKKDIENISVLQKTLIAKKLGSIKIKKGNYEVEVSKETSSVLKSSSFLSDLKNRTAYTVDVSFLLSPFFALLIHI